MMPFYSHVYSTPWSVFQDGRLSFAYKMDTLHGRKRPEHVGGSMRYSKLIRAQPLPWVTPATKGSLTPASIINLEGLKPGAEAQGTHLPVRISKLGHPL